MSAEDETGNLVALTALYAQEAALFASITTSLAAQLGLDLEAMDEPDQMAIVEEAEELTANWQTAEIDGCPTATTAFEKLLKEHHDVCERILDLRDTSLDEDRL
jgi:hypothetical protein